MSVDISRQLAKAFNEYPLDMTTMFVWGKESITADSINQLSKDLQAYLANPEQYVLGVEKHLAGQHDQKTHGHGKVGGEYEASVKVVRRSAESWAKAVGQKVPESQEEFDKWATENRQAIMNHMGLSGWDSEMVQYYRSQGVKDDVIDTYISGDYSRTEHYLDNLYDAKVIKDAKLSNAAALKRVNNEIDQAIEKGRVTIAISPEVMQEVFNDGKLKNQFQTGTSRGLLDERKRVMTEYVTQNIDVATKDGDRPIYGFVTVDGATTGNEPNILALDSTTVNHYGRWRVVLNENIKSHTSITIDDSFAVRGNSHPMTSMPSQSERIQMNISKTVAEFEDSRSYIETQTRGGVKTSDIAIIYAPAADLPQLQSMVKASGLDIATASIESVGTNG